MTTHDEPLSPRAPQPTAALIRRWKTMLPWQAKRARAAWYRDYGQGAQDPTTLAPPMPQLPERRPAPAKPIYEELARRTARKAELDDPNFAGTLTQEDLQIASPATVTRLLNSGQIYRDLGGPPPRPQERH